jgi:hypothetical protein
MRYAFNAVDAAHQTSESSERSAAFSMSVENSDDLQSGNVAVLLLVDISSRARLWGYSRFVFSRFSLFRVAGVRFFKMLGSGDQGGFGLKPSSTKQGLFVCFDNRTAADNFLNHSRLVNRYKTSAKEFLSVKLLPYSVKGTWGKNLLSVVADAPEHQPMAAITRASIRPAKAREFWKMQPATEISLKQSTGCLLATGVGEAPYLRQATFSVWQSVAAMDAYARSGAHLDAIKASRKGDFFSESMFVRFAIEDLQGTYNGQQFNLNCSNKLTVDPSHVQ